MSWIKSVFDRFRPVARRHGWKTIAHLGFLGGCAAITRGAWLMYKPAGYLTGGLLLIGISFLIGRDTAD